MAKNWSEAEVEAAVEDYFNMLRLELAGRKYNKTEHRRALMENLDNRTDSSVELKHQNISAVLIEMGIPYINGYKPRFILSALENLAARNSRLIETYHILTNAYGIFWCYCFAKL
ncbi:hypothetical protein [Thiolapillus sp.]|uniref:hypothetical protein n=1 Tax=Thiolapillus sp. TaxID=2017437 RepID=UPI003AF4A5BB